MPAPNDPSSLAKTDPYPEHQRMENVQRESHAIGEFIEWLEYNKHIALYHENRDGDEGFYPLGGGSRKIEQLVAEFFRIDLKKIEQEKKAMLREIWESTGDTEGD